MDDWAGSFNLWEDGHAYFESLSNCDGDFLGVGWFVSRSFFVSVLLIVWLYLSTRFPLVVCNFFFQDTSKFHVEIYFLILLAVGSFF